MPANFPKASQGRARLVLAGPLALALAIQIVPAASRAQTPPGAETQIRTYRPADFARFAPS
ncbi:MAG: hypothetical protein M3Q74_10150 [Pseudomonadota bacterium]|nr:hypothetical protein [Pseudomonadota bacterium]